MLVFYMAVKWIKGYLFIYVRLAFRQALNGYKSISVKVFNNNLINTFSQLLFLLRPFINLNNWLNVSHIQKHNYWNEESMLHKKKYCTLNNILQQTKLVYYESVYLRVLFV